MALKSHAKYNKKVTCSLENDMKNLANFLQNTCKCQNWDFDGILLSKVENAWAYDLQGSYVSWYWTIMQNLKRNWLLSSKLTWRTWQILTWALQNLKKVHFKWAAFDQSINVWADKIQTSYVWWHWRLMQNLKEKGLVLTKMTWGIWWIFTRVLKSLNIGTLMGSFYPKWKMYKLKICKGVMCHDTKQWCKISRGIDLLVQNWH